jgi:hypothetical protein
MAKFWREPLDADRHRDYMGGGYRGDGVQDAGGWPVDARVSDGWMYFVRECSFTFAFANLAQLEEARAYFERTVHPSTRRPGIELEHYWQRWHERLPAGLTAQSKRERIAAALRRAAEHFERGTG